MKKFLLDVNVLVALLWPKHAQHQAAGKWFEKHRKSGWATCPFTEAGFVRITSNPAFSIHSLRPTEAMKLLRENTVAEDHQFWPADFEVDAVNSTFGARMVNHQNLTDAYLLTLAIKRGGVLATFDTGIRKLFAGEDIYRKSLEVITE
ncbi:MAG: TA system VapC family ribonuclease toxin [Limisphaerales bacterium]